MSTSETPENFAFAATLGLVRAVRAMRWDQASEDAREVARHCILDFLGVAVAGSREPLTQILVDEIVKPERIVYRHDGAKDVEPVQLCRS